MGEAKRRRTLGRNIEVLDGPEEGLKRIALKDGQCATMALVGSGVILNGIADGTLGPKLLAKEVSFERHLFRTVFATWDRVRTREYDPWQCIICGASYSGIYPLSVLAVVDDPRCPPVPEKPAVVALVCGPCDSISTDETRRRLRECFGCSLIQEGYA